MSRIFSPALGVAIVAVAIALLLRAFVFHWALQETVPYVVFLAAVIVAAYFGGWKAGGWATLFGALVCAWYWLPDHDPRPDFTLSDVVRFPIFVAAGVVLSSIIHRMRSAQRLAQANERALRAQQELWRDTLASIGDGVIATDVDCRVVFLNAVAEGLTGWTQDECCGRPVAEILQLRDETTGTPWENPAAIALKENHNVVLSDQTVVVSRDGKTYFAELVAAPISSENDPGAMGAVLVFRDTTRRREDERKLQEMDRRKDEFLATLAHELRTPLAVIGNSVDVLHLDDEASPQVRDVISVLRRQQRQLTHLIDDLVDVSRISRGVIVLKKQCIDIREIVDSAVEAVRPHIVREEHTLTMAQASQPLHVEADPTRLNQIVVNLLTNATKYTPPGGHIRVSSVRDGEMATLIVEDDGIGIAPVEMPRIFEMFAQVGQSLRHDRASLGIGLTVVKRLVELHGGKIDARSEGHGRGSQFRVALPLAVHTEAPTKPTGPPNGTPARAHRVLLVEDDVDAREMLGRLLAMLGNTVVTAADAEEAWKRAATGTFDVVLSDISLPGVDGYELAAQLRQDDRFRDTYLVAVTGYAGPRDREKALAAGFDEHLVKPVSLARIRGVFSSVADAARTTQKA